MAVICKGNRLWGGAGHSVVSAPLACLQLCFHGRWAPDSLSLECALGKSSHCSPVVVEAATDSVPVILG